MLVKIENVWLNPTGIKAVCFIEGGTGSRVIFENATMLDFSGVKPDDLAQQINTQIKLGYH